MLKKEQDELIKALDKISLTDKDTYRQVIQITPQMKADALKVIKMLTKGHYPSTEHSFVIKSQQKSEDWQEQRKVRLTASNFKKYTHATTNTKLKIGYETLNINKGFTNQAVEYGNKNQNLARLDYEKLNPGYKIVESSLTVLTKSPWIGASPDGLVYNADNKLIGAVEIKCPFSKRNMTIEQAITSSPDFYLHKVGGKIALSEKHEYYYQIQGQIMVLDVDWIDFVVRTEKDLGVYRIERNDTFISDLYKKLTALYFQNYIWEVIKLFVKPEYLNKQSIYYTSPANAKLIIPQ